MRAREALGSASWRAEKQAEAGEGAGQPRLTRTKEDTEPPYALYRPYRMGKGLTLPPQEVSAAPAREEVGTHSHRKRAGEKEKRCTLHRQETPIPATALWASSRKEETPEKFRYHLGENKLPWKSLQLPLKPLRLLGHLRVPRHQGRVQLGLPSACARSSGNLQLQVRPPSVRHV